MFLQRITALHQLQKPIKILKTSYIKYLKSCNLHEFIIFKRRKVEKKKEKRKKRRIIRSGIT